MACDWREGEWEWDEEREQPIRRRVVLLPYTIVVCFLGALSMSYLLLFPPSAGALPTEGDLDYPSHTLRPVRRLLQQSMSDYYPYGYPSPSQGTDYGFDYGFDYGSDYGSDYQVYSDYDYATAHANMKRRWATAAPAIVSKTSTQLLTQSNRLPTLAQFLSLWVYLNPLTPVFTSIFDLVGLALPYWQGVVMPTLLFTTDGNREELRDVVLPLIGQVVHQFATVMDYAGADKL